MLVHVQTKRAIVSLISWFWLFRCLNAGGLWTKLIVPQQQRAARLLAFRDGSTALSGVIDVRQKGRIAADILQNSIVHQSAVNAELPRPRHFELMKRRMSKIEKSKPVCKQQIKKGSLAYWLRVALAGGLAGAAGTVALFPMDTAKTMRQSNPALYKNIFSALGEACYSNGRWHITRAYRGVIPSTLGAIPSSALYFGAYESMKTLVRRITGVEPTSMSERFFVHSLSAASGNVLSSAVFVPKEAIKQHMQYTGNAGIKQATAVLCKTKGIRGLYAGYQATLLRNIPTAALRFTLYEEFRHLWLKRKGASAESSPDSTQFDWGLFAAGAMAGILTSAIMTPVDVLKTRISTGNCPVDMPGCAQYIINEYGFRGLYAGAGSRMLGSACFSAIGFGVLEASRKWLGVAEQRPTAKPLKKPQINQHPSGFPIFTLPQRTLDASLRHSLEDKPKKK